MVMLGELFFFINQDPFDCEDDPCHLSWLIVDNRHLLDVLNSRGSVYCSNDTSFTSLDPEVLASECKVRKFSFEKT